MVGRDRSCRLSSSNVLPLTLRRFVEGHFDTVTAVEVLLLLRGDGSRPWSSDAVARRLRINHDQTEAILAGLDRRGLVRRHGSSFEYAPRTEEADGAVATLADVYTRYRHQIVGIIFTKRGPSDQGTTL